jgi:hypothetical protein
MPDMLLAVHGLSSKEEPVTRVNVAWLEKPESGIAAFSFSGAIRRGGTVREDHEFSLTVQG